MKKNKKIKIIIIIAFLMLFCILGILLKVLVQKNDEEKFIQAKSIENVEYYEGKVFPAGVYKLKYLYTQAGGKLDQEMLYKKLYGLSEYIQDLYDYLQKEENIKIEEYYDHNSDKLNNYGIINKDDFLTIISELKKIKVSNNELGNYKNSIINTESFKDEGDRCYFEINIKYEKFEEGITFKTTFLKYGSNNDTIQFKI